LIADCKVNAQKQLKGNCLYITIFFILKETTQKQNFKATERQQ
jgi:hypothetical protein